MEITMQNMKHEVEIIHKNGRDMDHFMEEQSQLGANDAGRELADIFNISNRRLLTPDRIVCMQGVMHERWSDLKMTKYGEIRDELIPFVKTSDGRKWIRLSGVVVDCNFYTDGTLKQILLGFPSIVLDDSSKMMEMLNAKGSDMKVMKNWDMQMTQYEDILCMYDTHIWLLADNIIPHPVKRLRRNYSLLLGSFVTILARAKGYRDKFGNRRNGLSQWALERSIWPIHAGDSRLPYNVPSTLIRTGKVMKVQPNGAYRTTDKRRWESDMKQIHEVMKKMRVYVGPKDDAKGMVMR